MGIISTARMRAVLILAPWLVIPVQCLAQVPAFESGDQVVIESMGELSGPRWLDGRTSDGSVGLAPTFDAPFTGTRWELTKLRENVYALKTLGNIEGPRWLDGRTADGSVGLAPTTEGRFTGTHWELMEVAPRVFTLRTLGALQGRRWLDGRTHSGTVGLAPQIGGVFSGSRWRVHAIRSGDVLTQHNDIGRSGASLAETVLEPSVLRAGRFGKIFRRDVDGQIYAQPLYAADLPVSGKGRHNVVFVATMLNYVYAFDADDPAQQAPLWRSTQLGTPVARANLRVDTLIDPAIGITSTPVIDLASQTMYVVAKSKSLTTLSSGQELKPGDRILLECMGQAPGSRWLDGRTQNQTVGLAPGTGAPFTGTVWTVGDAGNHRISLRNLGQQPVGAADFFLDGRTRDGTVGMAGSTNPPFTGTGWQIVDAGNSTFNVHNLGATEGPRWLDGRTGDATVGLAPVTTGVFTGTRWRIHRLSFHNTIHAIDLGTGRVTRSAEISGTAADIAFDATLHLNRPALLLLNDVVYVAFGAHADQFPWHGWVFGYEAADLSPAGVHVTTPVANGGGIWQAGNGLMGDPQGFVYFTTGNGDPNGPPPPRDLRNSFVKLRATGRALNFAGVFPPTHRPELDFCDLDLGSAGPVQIPGTRKLVGVGKEGVLHVLDMDAMSESQHFQASFRERPNGPFQPDSDKRACPRTFDFGVMYFYPHVHGSPVVWPLAQSGASLLFLWAEQDFMRSFVYDEALPRLEVAAIGSVPAPEHSMPGGVLSLSGDSHVPGSAIVWATRPSDCTDNNSVSEMNNRSCNAANKTAPGKLHAFDAVTLEELWNSDQHSGDRLGFLAKFAPPTIAHGKVYVASFGDPSPSTCNESACPSQLVVYGLLWGK